MNEISLIDDELAVDILSTPSISGALMTIVKGFKQHIEYTREESFKNFNRDLFSDFKVESQKEREKLIYLIQITIKEYKLLLSAAIEEEDKRKESVYCNIYKYILQNREKLNESKIMQLLRISKVLPYSAIELFPTTYAYNKFENLDTDIISYLSRLVNNPDLTYETNLLIHHGLYEELPIVGKGKSVKLANLFNEITTIFFKEYELTPEFLGLKTKEKIVKIIVLSDLEDRIEYQKLTTLFSQAKIEVKSNIHFNTKPNNNPSITLAIASQNISPINNYACLFNQKSLSKETINNLKINLQGYNILKVTFHENTIDPIPEIGNKLIYIDLKDKNSKDSFINSVEIQ